MRMLPSTVMPQNLPRLSTQSGFPRPAEGNAFQAVDRGHFRVFVQSSAQNTEKPLLGLLCAGRPVGPSALFSGTLCNVSNGLSASLETLTNSKTHGVLPTPHTGATRGMERPCFWTRRGVLWLRVLYSKYLLFSLPLPRCQRCIRRHT